MSILPEGVLDNVAAAAAKAEVLAGKVKNKAIVLLDDIIKFVNKSYAELKKFFDDLFAKIKKWLLKAKNNLSKVQKIVPEVTEELKNHLKYGEIKITIKNSSTGEVLSTKFRKPRDPSISVPDSGVNVSVDVSGIHFESAFQTGLIEEIASSRTLVKTLKSGEQVFKSKIKVFVQEMNNGRGGWTNLANEKTWWPSSWNDQKVWEKISEAFNNKVNIQGSKWHGTTNDGIKIEMYMNTSGKISTAYIIP